MTDAFRRVLDGKLAAQQSERQESVGSKVFIGYFGCVDFVERLLQLLDLQQHVSAAQCYPRKHDVCARAVVWVLRLHLNAGGFLRLAVLVLHPRNRRLIIVGFFVEGIAGTQFVNGPIDQPASRNEVSGIAHRGSERHVALDPGGGARVREIGEQADDVEVTALAHSEPRRS